MLKVSIPTWSWSVYGSGSTKLLKSVNIIVICNLTNLKDRNSKIKFCAKNSYLKKNSCRIRNNLKIQPGFKKSFQIHNTAGYRTGHCGSTTLRGTVLIRIKVISRLWILIRTGQGSRSRPASKLNIQGICVLLCTKMPLFWQKTAVKAVFYLNANLLQRIWILCASSTCNDV